MELLRRMGRQSPLLLSAAAVLAAALPFFLAGLIFDPRVITGAPAWLKPAKFALSSAIYAVTIAWLILYIRVWPRAVVWAGRTMAVTLVLEVAIIAAQAWRGHSSHFNIATPSDAIPLTFMAAFIAALLMASFVIFVALWRSPVVEASWGWALKLGMLISVAGLSSGGLMLPPTPPQRAALESGQGRVSTIGAHTVGRPDGGPGLPGVNWSTEGGDLRIPHFVGMHGIHVVPLLAWLFARQRTSTVFVLAASYLGVFAILTWQALRGQSIVAPDDVTLRFAALWLIATVTSLWVSSKYPATTLHVATSRSL